LISRGLVQRRFEWLLVIARVVDWKSRGIGMIGVFGLKSWPVCNCVEIGLNLPVLVRFREVVKQVCLILTSMEETPIV
jgi:hypothetical protein